MYRSLLKASIATLRLALLPLALNSGALQAAEPTWNAGVALFSGTCHPDLEKKFHDDVMGGAVFFGGSGFSSSWQSGRCSGFPLSIEHTMDRWRFTGEMRRLTSSYSYNQGFQYAQVGTTYSRMDSVSIQDRSRTDLSILAAYSLHPDTPDQGFSLLGGIRSLSMESQLDTLAVNTATNGFGSATGMSIFPENTVRQTARGPVMGVQYMLPVSAFKLDAGLLLFNMNGSWQHHRTQAEAPGGGLEIRNEDGLFRMQGYRLSLGGEIPLGFSNLSLFVRLSQESSTNRDSSVSIFKVATGSLASGVTPAALIQDAALTYGGSADRERWSGLDIGIKWGFL